MAPQSVPHGLPVDMNGAHHRARAAQEPRKSQARNLLLQHITTLAGR